MKFSLGLFVVPPLLAHHSIYAEYELSKTTAIQGIVTKVDWMNPHARFYLDVAEADGKVTRWEIETGSPNSLMNAGWKRDTIKQGDQISVDTSTAKDGSKLGYARLVTWPDGRMMTVPLYNWGTPIPK